MSLTYVLHMPDVNATLNGTKDEVKPSDSTPRERTRVIYAQPLAPALTSSSVQVTQVTQKTNQMPQGWETLGVGQLFSRSADGVCVHLKVSKSKAISLDDARPMKLSPDQQISLRIHRVWFTTF